MITRSRSLPAALGLVVTLGAVSLTVGAGMAAAEPGPSAQGGRQLQVAGFLGEQRLPNAMQFQGTTVGGFSGLDRDRRSGTWFIVSDDRSALQPARFYSADLKFEGPDGALSGVELTGTAPFQRPDGSTYPALEGGDGTTVDPEDIRVDPISGRLVWIQEGDRIVPTDGTPPTLIDPTVRFAERDGRFVSELPVPAEQRPDAGQRGIRQNLGPEGLTFAARGALVVTALEGPLLQDGPPATRTTGALSRIVVQKHTGEVRAQYAYPQEPVFADPVPAGGSASTGVSAILAVGDNDPTRFLVMERSFVAGVGNKVRIYEVSTAGATNLAKGTPIADARPVRKHLLVDVADLPVKSVDNIEGMAWGPERRDGSRALVLVSDDNFSATQVTQFVALAVR
ncbi:esterase-like activity of phytase family protein [Pseudonocardia aurantiaca]|uniref:Esterase-like activity of phytase family protein n=1 Tax=Pseudonocardia aurantiaca TaxID=75290 RepID=A0ABW4FGZ8_9PSEU